MHIFSMRFSYFVGLVVPKINGTNFENVATCGLVNMSAMFSAVGTLNSWKNSFFLNS